MLFVYIGWLGTFLYLANHTYISVVINWHRPLYFSGNFIAATALVVQSVHLLSWQAVAINGFWMIISACLLVKVSFENIKLSATAYYKVCTVLALALLITATFVDWLQMIEILGWSSAFVFCSCYFLFSAKKISTRSYLFLNVYAATALLPQLWFSQNWPVFTLELVWALMSIYGVIKSYQEVHLID